MAGGNVSPRQKMINMMYLVLTALLALNVSKEVLLAFTKINTSLENSNNSTIEKTDQIAKALAKEYGNNKAKVQKNYDKSIEVQSIIKDYVAFIDKLRTEMIDVTGDLDGKLSPGDYKDPLIGVESGWVGEGNIDIATTLLIGPTRQTARGKDFEDRVKIIRKKLTDIMGEENSGLIRIEEPKAPPVRTGEVAKNWLEGNFDHMPLAGVVTILTKMENDARITEANIVTNLLGSIDALDVKVNKLDAKVIAKSTYVLQGGTFEADIIVAAMDSTAEPQAFLAGSTTALPIEGGMAKLKMAASAVGEKKFSGIVKIKDPSQPSGFRDLPFSSSYEVGAPVATISPTKMNVFYIGVPNPVSISASGVPLSAVKPSISAGSLTPVSGKPGEFEVRVTTPGEVNVVVMATIDKGTKKMGEQMFRVKRIPDPTARIGFQKPGRISSEVLSSQGGILAVLEGFDFDAKFTVASYKVYITPPRADFKEYSSSSAAFTSEIKTALGQYKLRGTTVMIDDITVVGPDGGRRNLDPVVYKIQ